MYLSLPLSLSLSVSFGITRSLLTLCAEAGPGMGQGGPAVFDVNLLNADLAQVSFGITRSLLALLGLF
jgi:hypothetical protein